MNEPLYIYNGPWMRSHTATIWVPSSTIISTEELLLRIFDIRFACKLSGVYPKAELIERVEEKVIVASFHQCVDNAAKNIPGVFAFAKCAQYFDFDANVYFYERFCLITYFDDNGIFTYQWYRRTTESSDEWNVYHTMEDITLLALKQFLVGAIDTRDLAVEIPDETSEIVIAETPAEMSIEEVSTPGLKLVSEIKKDTDEFDIWTAFSAIYQVFYQFTYYQVPPGCLVDQSTLDDIKQEINTSMWETELLQDGPIRPFGFYQNFIETWSSHNMALLRNVDDQEIVAILPIEIIGEREDT